MTVELVIAQQFALIDVEVMMVICVGFGECLVLAEQGSLSALSWAFLFIFFCP